MTAEGIRNIGLITLTMTMIPTTCSPTCKKNSSAFRDISIFVCLNTAVTSTVSNKVNGSNSSIVPMSFVKRFRILPKISSTRFVILSLHCQIGMNN